MPKKPSSSKMMQRPSKGGPKAASRGKNERGFRSEHKENATPKGWLYGRHAVVAALIAGRRELKTLWLTKSDGEIEKLAAKFPKLRIEMHERSDFDGMFQSVNHQGIALQCGGLPTVRLDEAVHHTRLLMLDQVTDPHNLGAILRSADAFGFGAVLTPSHNAAAVNDVVAKTACGGLETVPVIEVGNLNHALKALQTEGYWSIGLAGEATQTLPEMIAEGLPEKICVVMGSEGEGLRRLVAENCDYLVKIPMCGTVESLNVSVATGIVLQALMKR